MQPSILDALPRNPTLNSNTANNDESSQRVDSTNNENRSREEPDLENGDENDEINSPSASAEIEDNISNIRDLISTQIDDEMLDTRESSGYNTASSLTNDTVTADERPLSARCRICSELESNLTSLRCGHAFGTA